MITIPVAKPEAGEEEIRAVSAVLKSGMFAQGPVVRQFENEFAALCNTRHAIAVNNGTAALHAALALTGIHAGDEVIVPTFSFFATASCVSMCGGKPVFVDVDEHTFGIDPTRVNEAITKKTKAVIGVHLFGQPFDVQPVQEICDDHKIPLIEDAAQAHGALYRNKPVGSLGKVGCFSFYPTKNMTTGEGGIITTNDDHYASVIRQFINHGQSEKYLHTMIGYNYRMTDIGAAIGREQLQKLAGFNARREENARYLSSHIRHSGILTPRCMPDVQHVFHQYVLRVLPDFPLKRSELVTLLAEKGIGTAIHYPIPIHQQPVYRNEHDTPSCPVAERLSGEVLSLPVHPNVTASMLGVICNAINGVT
jgi:perosamine synthetase